MRTFHVQGTAYSDIQESRKSSYSGWMQAEDVALGDGMA